MSLTRLLRILKNELEVFSDRKEELKELLAIIDSKLRKNGFRAGSPVQIEKQSPMHALSRLQNNKLKVH